MEFKNKNYSVMKSTFVHFLVTWLCITVLYILNMLPKEYPFSTQGERTSIQDTVYKTDWYCMLYCITKFTVTKYDKYAGPGFFCILVRSPCGTLLVPFFL